MIISTNAPKFTYVSLKDKCLLEKYVLYEWGQLKFSYSKKIKLVTLINSEAFQVDYISLVVK